MQQSLQMLALPLKFPTKSTQAHNLEKVKWIEKLILILGRQVDVPNKNQSVQGIASVS